MVGWLVGWLVSWVVSAELHGSVGSAPASYLPGGLRIQILACRQTVVTESFVVLFSLFRHARIILQIRSPPLLCRLYVFRFIIR